MSGHEDSFVSLERATSTGTARCQVTRTARDWTMPEALRQYVAEQRALGHELAGPFVFHCRHRTDGVGMIDVRDVLDADREIAGLGGAGSADVIIGTVSHCHGAIGRLCIGGLTASDSTGVRDWRHYSRSRGCLMSGSRR